ncbi:hypothetical protein CYMTET_39678, partial [Cymbomonas tetramitiformis]
IVEGKPGDGALGGTFLTATQNKRLYAGLPVDVKNATSLAVGLLVEHKGGQELLPLIEPAEPLPCKRQHTWRADEREEVSFTVVQRLPCPWSDASQERSDKECWMPLSVSQSPLRSQEGDAPVTLESATSVMELDADGLLHLRLEDLGSPTAASQAAAHRKNSMARVWKMLSATLLLLFLLSPMVYMAYDQHSQTVAAAERHYLNKLRLENYYKKHIPDKLAVDDVDAMLEATMENYAGKEHILWKHLEKKYGFFPIIARMPNKTRSSDL